MVIERLVDEGYTIRDKDEEYGTVTTDPNPAESINVSQVINFRVKDSTITVSGRFMLNVSINGGGATGPLSRSTDK